MGLFDWMKKKPQAGGRVDNNSIRFTPWLIRDDEIIREYIYGDNAVVFQVHVTLRGGMMGVSRHVNFILKPIIVGGEGFVVGQLAIAGQRVDASFITLRSEEIAGGANLFGISEREHADNAVAMLKQGQDLQFQLVSNREVLLDLILPNDRSFAETYKPLFDRMNRENPIRFPR